MSRSWGRSGVRPLPLEFESKTIITQIRGNSFGNSNVFSKTSYELEVSDCKRLSVIVLPGRRVFVYRTL